MTDPRLAQIDADTKEIAELHKRILELRARRAENTWSLVGDPNLKETIASIAREIGEPQVRFRKSVERYRDGIPNFKRAVV